MKKLFLVVIVGFTFGSGLTFAQQGDDKMFGVNFDVLGVLLNDYSGSVEMKLPIPKLTAKVDVNYSPNYFWVSGVSGLDLTGKVRFYYGSLLPFDFPDYLSFLKKGPLQGLYAGGGVSVHSWSWSYGGSSLSYFTPGIVVEAGAKYFPTKDWSWWPANFYTEGGLVLSVNLPAKWKYSGGGEFSGTEPSTPGAFGFKVDFGYAF